MTIRKEIELYKNVARENPQSLIQKINTPGATTALEGMMIMTALSEVGRDANAFAAQNIPNPQPTILETISQSAPVNVASKSLEGEPSPQAAVREPRGSESTGIPGAISAFEGGLVAMKDGGTIYAKDGFFKGLKNKGLDFLLNLRKKQAGVPDYTGFGNPAKVGLGTKAIDFIKRNPRLIGAASTVPYTLAFETLDPTLANAGSDVIMPAPREAANPEEQRLMDVPIDAGYLEKEVAKLIEDGDVEKLTQVKTILENEPNPSKETQLLMGKIDSILPGLESGEKVDLKEAKKLLDSSAIDDDTTSTKRKETETKEPKGLLAKDMKEGLLSGDIDKKVDKQEVKSDFVRNIESSVDLYKQLGGDKEKYINQKKEIGGGFFTEYGEALDKRQAALDDFFERENIRTKKLDEASQKRMDKLNKRLEDMKSTNKLSEMRFLAFQLMGAKGPTLEALGNIGLNYEAFSAKNRENLQKFESAKDDLEFELARYNAEKASASDKERMTLKNSLADARMTFKQAKSNFEAGIVDDFSKLDQEALSGGIQLLTLKTNMEQTANMNLFKQMLQSEKINTNIIKGTLQTLNQKANRITDQLKIVGIDKDDPETIRLQNELKIIEEKINLLSQQGSQSMGLQGVLEGLVPTNI